MKKFENIVQRYVNSSVNRVTFTSIRWAITGETRPNHATRRLTTVCNSLNNASRNVKFKTLNI